MLALPITFRLDRFDFELIERHENIAILRKTKKGIDSVFWEVVVVQKVDDHTWPNGNTTPAHEHMPHSNLWGTLGWSLQTRDRAFQKFKELISRHKLSNG